MKRLLLTLVVLSWLVMIVPIAVTLATTSNYIATYEANICTAAASNSK